MVFPASCRDDDGLLHLEPLDLRVGEGHVTGRIEVDGRQAPVRADVALQMQRVSVARLLNRLDVDVATLGPSPARRAAVSAWAARA